MRSWTPRSPSASIKRRLFPKAATWQADLPHPIAWRWLAPAMALCFAALILLARSPQSALGRSGDNLLAPTFALSNLDFATYYAAAGQKERNLVHATFEWTNDAHSTTTAPSFRDGTGYRE